MSSYEDKIKKELIEKIRRFCDIYSEMNDYEVEHPEDTNEEWFNDVNYMGLCVAGSELQEEIDELMLETKYIPLTGLSESHMKLFESFAETVEANINQYIEKHLDVRLLKLKEEMRERIKQTKGLRMTAHLDPYTASVYSEIVSCYIHGSFKACCVLCRSVVEFIAKRFIQYKGYGELLVAKDKQKKTMSIPVILYKYHDSWAIPKKKLDEYKKIVNKADKILHTKEEKANENDALEAIQILQSFIKKFPKTA